MARTGRGFPATAIVHRFTGETVAPSYSVAPAVAAVTASTVNFTATATDNLGGLIDHFVGLYDAGSTPTAAQVVAGTGTGFIAADSELAIASGAGATFTQITGIAHNGFPYRGAFTARDGYGNLTTVVYVDFYTILGLATRGELTVTGFAGSLSAPRTITVAGLALRAGTVRANLVSLRWAWFDQDQIGVLSAPVEQGAGETTDSNGDLVITLTATTLTSGQIGRLLLETNDKVSLGHYRVTIP